MHILSDLQSSLVMSWIKIIDCILDLVHDMFHCSHGTGSVPTERNERGDTRLKGKASVLRGVKTI